MKPTLLLLIILLSYKATFGQCSDAGFCSISIMQPDEAKKPANRLNIGTNYALGDNKVNIITSFLDYRRALSDNLGVTGKLVFTRQSSSHALVGIHANHGAEHSSFSSSALSDGFITFDYKIDNSSIIAGLKIPFVDGGRSFENAALPMDFQPSLGTYDFILGYSMNFDNYQFTAGLQVPLTQNKNRFLNPSEDDSQEVNYLSTFDYVRRPDLMLRLAYPIKLSEKINFIPTALPILHLGEDRRTNIAGQRESIPGSSGLTFNINLFFDYKLNENHTLQLNMASPIVARKARPDGLTRGFVVGLEYIASF